MANPVLILAALLTLPVALSLATEAPEARAWQILRQALRSGGAAQRGNAVHALRLLPGNPAAEEMAENALTDRSLKVRAIAAGALGLMGAVSAGPRLKAAPSDKEPAVVLAAARSLFLLDEREAAFEIDYELLIGERRARMALWGLR